MPEGEGTDPRSLFPLRGIRVLELGASVASGVCAKVLTDGGATVTRLTLEDLPHLAIPPDHDWQRFLDRGKEHIRRRAEQGSDRSSLEELLRSTELVVSCYQHRELAPLDLDCAAMLERHPHLTVACITPFGQDGPYSSYRASEVAIAALAGLSDATPGFPDRREYESDPPLQSLAPLTQIAGGLSGACAVSAALVAGRRGRRRPRHIELSVLEAAVSMMTFEWGLTAYGGGIRGRRPGHSDVEPNYYARCRDGDVIVAAFTQQHWQSFVELMGDPEWARDQRFADVETRTEHWQELHGRIDEWASEQTGFEILEAAQARGLPFCPAFELSDTVSSEHVRILEGVEEEGDDVFPSDPILIDGTRRLRRRRESAGRGARPDGHDGAEPAQQDGDAGLEHDGAAPLAGIRVLDLTQYVAGPFAAQVLASLGAEVILVESGTHLVTRQIPPFAGEPVYDASMNFNYVNRGKKSVLVNLRTEQGRAILDELLATADVVLENFSRRAVDRLGLTWEQVSVRHPQIVLGSISGFGRSGPWGGYVALHSGVILLSGLASVTRDEQARPRLVGSIYPDLLTGAWLAGGVQQALISRAQTGCGVHVEVSMLDVLLSSMGGLITHAVQGRPMEPERAAIFLPTREPNRFVALAADEYEQAGGEELAREARALTRVEAMERFQGRGLEAAAVLDIGEVVADPHLAHHTFVELDRHPIAGVKPAPGVPWLFDGERGRLLHAPRLGADTERVLTELGCPQQELKALAEQGVLV